jgi:hypothetical protein
MRLGLVDEKPQVLFTTVEEGYLIAEHELIPYIAALFVVGEVEEQGLYPQP